MIYRKSGRYSSAKSCFRKAFQQDPSNLSACYALSELLFQDKNYFECIRLCDLALTIRPQSKSFLLLKSQAIGEDIYSDHRMQQIHRDNRMKLIHRQYCKKVKIRIEKPLIPLCQITMALAWRDLIQEFRRGSQGEAEQYTAALATKGLADAYKALTVLDAANFNKHLNDQKRTLQQAIRFYPKDSLLHWELGMIFFQKGNFASALNEFKSVSDKRLAPHERPLFWAMMSETHFNHMRVSSPKDEHRNAAELALVHLIDTTCLLEPDDFNPLISRLKLNSILTLWTIYQPLMTHSGLQTFAERHVDEYAFITPAEKIIRSFQELSSFNAQDHDIKEHARLLNTVVSFLEKKHSSLIQQNGIYLLLAQKLTQIDTESRNHQVEALRYAHLEVAHDPEDTTARSTLCEIYSKLGHTQKAKQEIKTWFNLQPDSKMMWAIINTCFNAAQQTHAEERLKTYEQFIPHLENALSRLEISESTTTAQLDHRSSRLAQLHSILGHMHRDLLQYHKAFEHFRIADALFDEIPQHLDDLSTQQTTGHLDSTISRFNNRLSFGEAYLEHQSYTDAHQILSNTAQQMKHIERELTPFQDWTEFKEQLHLLQSIKIKIKLALAYSHALRGANYYEVIKLCQEAKTELDNNGGHMEDINYLRSRAHHIRAVNQYHRTMRFYNALSLKLCFTELFYALDNHADTETYLFLTKAYLLQFYNNKTASRHTLHLARDACMQARHCDFRKKHKKELQDLLSEITTALQSLGNATSDESDRKDPPPPPSASAFSHIRFDNSGRTGSEGKRGQS